MFVDWVSRDKKNVEEEEQAEVLDRLLLEKLPDKC